MRVVANDVNTVWVIFVHHRREMSGASSGGSLLMPRDLSGDRGALKGAGGHGVLLRRLHCQHRFPQVGEL